LKSENDNFVYKNRIYKIFIKMCICEKFICNNCQKLKEHDKSIKCEICKIKTCKSNINYYKSKILCCNMCYNDITEGIVQIIDNESINNIHNNNNSNIYNNIRNNLRRQAISQSSSPTSLNNTFEDIYMINEFNNGINNDNNETNNDNNETNNDNNEYSNNDNNEYSNDDNNEFDTDYYNDFINETFNNYGSHQQTINNLPERITFMFSIPGDNNR
jgi:hypothetical protein